MKADGNLCAAKAEDYRKHARRGRRQEENLILLCLGFVGGGVLQGQGELFVHFVSREKMEK